jgi:hypothetical protein
MCNMDEGEQLLVISALRMHSAKGKPSVGRSNRFAPVSYDACDSELKPKRVWGLTWDERGACGVRLRRDVANTVPSAVSPDVS